MTKLADFVLGELHGEVELDFFQSESVPELLNFVFFRPRFSCVLSRFGETFEIGGKSFLKVFCKFFKKNFFFSK